MRMVFYVSGKYCFFDIIRDSFTIRINKESVWITDFDDSLDNSIGCDIFEMYYELVQILENYDIVTRYGDNPYDNEDWWDVEKAKNWEVFHEVVCRFFR